MSLVALKKYMMDVKIDNLFNISRHFNVDPDVVRCQLSHWINKGCIKKCTKKPECGTKCHKCAAIFTEVYEWTPAAATD